MTDWNRINQTPINFLAWNDFLDSSAVIKSERLFLWPASVGSSIDIIVGANCDLLATDSVVSSIAIAVRIGLIMTFHFPAGRVLWLRINNTQRRPLSRVIFSEFDWTLFEDISIRYGLLWIRWNTKLIFRTNYYFLFEVPFFMALFEKFIKNQRVLDFSTYFGRFLLNNTTALNSKTRIINSFGFSFLM